MRLSPSTKLGIIAFLLVDVALAIVLISLYTAREDRALQTELREIGSTIYADSFKLSNFSLIDQDNNQFSNVNFTGNWNLVFFGFTSCPDICPITMAELDRLSRQWDERTSGELPRVIFATVDPDTDTPERMKEYLEDFNPEFIGLTGNRSSLARFADELFVAFGESEKTELQLSEHSMHNNPANASDYVIDHSSHISVIDPNGDLLAVMRPPHRAKDILESLRLITQ